jgi:hypothetical protein
VTTHARAVRRFARKLALLLACRAGVRWAAPWFFAWGAIVLAARIAGGGNERWMWAGLAGFLPLAILAAIRDLRRHVRMPGLRAAYDGINRCGGIVMAGDAADTSGWMSVTPPPATPGLCWRWQPASAALAVSLLFVLVALSLPDRVARLGMRRPLEIGSLVGELKNEVALLKEEKILEPEKARDLEQQLGRLKEQSSAADPNRTWEALDHIKESNSSLAQQAAEESLTKMTRLSQAETLASALQSARESGMAAETATQAARDLAGMLRDARLEDGLVKGQIPPDLLSNLDGLSPKEMADLIAAIELNKGQLGRTLTNLANLRLVDAKVLSQCRNAGQCRNPGALAEFLSQCTNQSESFAQLAACYGRGGVSRDEPADTPMTWKDESPDQGARFKEEALPPASQLSDSQLAGVSRSAPELDTNAVVAGPGALANAAAGGGAAHTRPVLPRYKHAVQQFFKRDD